MYFASTNVVMNYTETEAKVREATNDEAWGPTGAILQVCHIFISNDLTLL